MPSLPPLTLLDGTEAAHGAARLAELPLVPMHWLAPYPGREAAFSEALQAAHGLRFPEPGQSAQQTSQAGAVEIRWAGRAQAVLIGPDAADPSLAPHGAVTDVSDVWTRLALAGPATPDVLARLIPLDLRRQSFPPGRTARTLLGHIAAHLTATQDGIELMVMRSYARTAFHEVEAAMRRVAARPV